MNDNKLNINIYETIYVVLTYLDDNLIYKRCIFWNWSFNMFVDSENNS